MKKFILFLVIFFTFLLFPFNVKCQYNILFGEDGTLKSGLPEKLSHNDFLLFNIQISNDYVQNYIVDRNKKIGSAIEKLKHLSQNERLVLEKIYGINSVQVTQLINDLESGQSRDGRGVPNITPPIPSNNHGFFSIIQPNGEVFFEQSLNSYTAELRINSAINNEKTKLELSLKKYDLLQAAVLSWVNRTDFGTEINLARFHELKQGADTLAKNAEVILTKDSYGASTIAVKYTTLINSLNQIIDQEISQSSFNSKAYWIKKWIWYTGGVPQLNPFPFKGTKPVEPDTSELSTFRLRLSVCDSTLKKINLSSIPPRMIDSLIEIRQSLAEKIAKIERSYQSYQKQLSASEQNKIKFTTTASILNNTTLYVSSYKSKTPENGPILWMIHHDLANENEPMNSNEMDGYIETDREVVLAHNIVRGEKINKGNRYIDISEDVPEWIGNLKAVLGTVTNQINLLNKKTAKSIPFGGRICNLCSALDTLKERIILLNYLVQQSNPDFQIEPRIEKDPVYHTEVITSNKRTKGPRIFQYWIKSSKAAEAQPPDTFQYRINKLYRIMPFAGVAFGTTKFDNLTINSSQTAPELLEHKYIVTLYTGIKVYPFRKIDIQSGRFFLRKDERGNYLLASRINLQFGISIPTPLNNLYGGIGIDLFPGVNLSGGAMFNKYTTYGFKDGKLEHKDNQYRVGGYIGLSTDLTLFTEVIKLIGL